MCEYTCEVVNSYVPGYRGVCSRAQRCVTVCPKVETREVYVPRVQRCAFQGSCGSCDSSDRQSMSPLQHTLQLISYTAILAHRNDRIVIEYISSQNYKIIIYLSGLHTSTQIVHNTLRGVVMVEYVGGASSVGFLQSCVGVLARWSR